MASEQVGSRKKQARSTPREEHRHPVLYRHQDCIPTPKLLQTCERQALLGLKSNQNHDTHGRVNTEQESNDQKNNPKKLSSSKNKHDDKSEKVVLDTKLSPQQSNGTIGNNEELSKSRKRRLRKRRLLVALAPTLSSKPSPPPVENTPATKPNPRPIAQVNPAVPPVASVVNRNTDQVKTSVKESRKRPEKSINSRSKSLKSKSLAETTHQSKVDIIKTLEEKTLNSLLQTLVPLTNSSPKKEKPSVPLFSFPEKKLNSSESKVDKDGVFYFGETKHQLEKLSSSFGKYGTSPFPNKSETAQNVELNKNCFSANIINSLENCVPSFNFSPTATDRLSCSPNLTQHFYGAETISPGTRVESNNIFSLPSNYQPKDFIFNSPVLKDLNQIRSELHNFSGPSLAPALTPTCFTNRPNNINVGEINFTKTTTNPAPIETLLNSCCVSKINFETESKPVESNTSESVGKSPVIMKPTDETNKTNKTREEILLEREAKKAAKLAAKMKKSAQNSKGDASNVDVSKVESKATNNNQNDHKSENKNISGIRELLPEKESDRKSDLKTDNLSENLPLTVKKETQDAMKNKGSNEIISQDASVKSKAELRAERRAKQEAQRAAKTSKPQPKEKAPQGKAEQPKPVSSTGQTEKKVEVIKTSSRPKPKLFSHLYREKTSLPSDKLLKAAGLHPAVVRLGVQYATRVVVGSNARCVALLHALKQMVIDYTTPSEKDFSRGLEEELGPVTVYLNQCRPLAVSMTNALRHIKRTLTQLPNNIPDIEAKRKICDVVDTYIHEQIDVAGKAICNTVKSKIANGDVILIYGCSSLLTQILVESHLSGTKFRVVVVDGLPWLEGREMLRRLVEKGLSCTYVLITAASFIMREVTKVLLGAHALLANGYVMSRAGSSQLALLAHCCNVPVLVCCETHKFCERVQTDAFVYNELGKLRCDKIKDKDKGRTLTNLTPLSLAYDITPPDLVSAVVTELAVLPCTSVPVILRIKPSECIM